MKIDAKLIKRRENGHHCQKWCPYYSVDRGLIWARCLLSGTVLRHSAEGGHHTCMECDELTKQARSVEATEASFWHWLYDLYIPLMNGKKTLTVYLPWGTKLCWADKHPMELGARVPAYEDNCALCKFARELAFPETNERVICLHCPVSRYHLICGTTGAFWTSFIHHRTAWHAKGMLVLLQHIWIEEKAKLISMLEVLNND